MSEKNLFSDTKTEEFKQAASDIDPSLSALEIDMIKNEAMDEAEAEETIIYEQTKRKNEMSIDVAMNMVNPETPSRFLVSRPSMGTLEGVTEIHTRPAFIILLGRAHGSGGKAKAGITGVYGFAKKVREMVAAYHAGCPFAAKILIDLEQDITHVHELFEVKEGEIKKMVQNISRLKLKPFVARRTAAIEVTFANPYAYHILDLLLRFDDMVRVMLPYQQVKMINYETYDNHVKEIGRHLRRLCCSCDHYFFVGMQATLAENDVYQSAINRLGELDPRIMEGKFLPNFVPIPNVFVR